MSLRILLPCLRALRFKTLTASFVPILMATAWVKPSGDSFWISWFALVSSFCIQMATNVFNDALDYKKGADTASRLGELRVTASGQLSFRQVMSLGFILLGVAFVFGWPLVVHGGGVILVIGLISVLLAYCYTGGPFPLAYLGLGDVFVVIFFGLIPVGGVVYLYTQTWPLEAVVVGLLVGLLSCTLLAINNIRDREQDERVNKRTLSVRLGEGLAPWELPILYGLVFGLMLYWGFSQGFSGEQAVWILAPFALKLSRQVLSTDPGAVYNRYLAQAALIHVLFGLIWSVGHYAWG